MRTLRHSHGKQGEGCAALCHQKLKDHKKNYDF